MNNSLHSIPWDSKTEWQEVVLFFHTIETGHSRSLGPVKALAQKIQLRIAEICDAMDHLCAVTCPACLDPCCARATVWYDFKDLICLKFGTESVPDRQITKTASLAGPVCANLTKTGCALPRTQRPFVCTWYLCPDQKSLCQPLSLSQKIDEIKRFRHRMEEMFCSITAG